MSSWGTMAILCYRILTSLSVVPLARLLSNRRPSSLSPWGKAASNPLASLPHHAWGPPHALALASSQLNQRKIKNLRKTKSGTKSARCLSSWRSPRMPARCRSSGPTNTWPRRSSKGKGMGALWIGGLSGSFCTSYCSVRLRLKGRGIELRFSMSWASPCVFPNHPWLASLQGIWSGAFW